MGLFGDIGSFFSGAAKAVATGGLSLVAPKLIPKFIDKPLTAITKAQFPTTVPKLIQTATLAAGPVFPTTAFGPLIARPLAGFSTQGVQPMSLNIGGILQGVSGIFGGNQNPIFQGISNVAGLASQFVPQPATQIAMRPVGPAVGMLPRVGAMVGRGFFNRFPNLALALQQLRARGVTVSRKHLWSLLKRFGPELLVTGGILTAAAVSELMVAGPGTRRMNPGNAKALRRSLRRVEAFHRLCVRADTLRRPRGRRKAPGSIGAQFVRQG